VTCTPALPTPHCPYCGCDRIEWLGTMGVDFHWYRCKRYGCYREFTLSGPPEEVFDVDEEDGDDQVIEPGYADYLIDAQHAKEGD